jgi:hypothetical protein
MSLTSLLAMNGVMHLRPSGGSRYRVLEARAFRAFLIEDLPAVPATELKLHDALSPSGPPPGKGAGNPLPLWVRVAFLLALLLLCTGVMQLNSLHQQRQMFALGQAYRVQETRADQFRWIARWYRARLAVEQQAREADIQPYPPPRNQGPLPHTRPGRPERVRPPLPRVEPRIGPPSVAAVERVPVGATIPGAVSSPVAVVTRRRDRD